VDADSFAKDERKASADGEAAWSWRPDAGVKFASNLSRTMVARKPGHQGERGGNRKTIAQGK
jgi:hypothetical protein